MNVAIVVPAHNEEERIGRLLENYLRYFGDKGVDFKIVVVLNACVDNTKGVVERFMCENLEILEFEQGGKGFAIIEGFKYALKEGFDLIGFVDADMSTPPEAFYDLVVNMRGVDGVIANRWDKRSVIKTKQTLFRRFISRGFNLIVRGLFLFNHRDTQCGAKMFRAGVIERILPKLGNTNWAFDIDLLFYARRSGAKIISIPTIWEDVDGSKVNLKKTPLKMFLSVLRLRLVHSPFRFLLRFNQKLPEKIRIKP